MSPDRIAAARVDAAVPTRPGARPDRRAGENVRVTASTPDRPPGPETGPAGDPGPHSHPTAQGRAPRVGRAAPPGRPANTSEALITSALGRAREPDPGPGRRRQADFTSAVYGSVVAGTVIVTAGGATPVVLAVMLLVSGVVFWLAHVYALTVANVHGGWEFGAIRRGLRKEWPVAFAAIPPAIAALTAGFFDDVSPADGAWIALVVAIVEQQVWGYAAARRSGMTGLALVRTITLNVLIGVVVVVLKVGVGH